jgi:hypothetical protein
MRKLIADEWMSLDGVVQGPSYAGEDTQGGFSRGGWHIAYFDPRVLADYDLVDDYRLMIDPVVVGKGKRLFGDHAPLRHFRLEDCTPTTTGAILATFRRERSARDDKDAG